MQMMGQNGMAGHVEGRIAFLKTELKITEAQQPLWDGVADATCKRQGYDRSAELYVHDAGMYAPREARRS